MRFINFWFLWNYFSAIKRDSFSSAFDFLVSDHVVRNLLSFSLEGKHIDVFLPFLFSRFVFLLFVLKLFQLILLLLAAVTQSSGESSSSWFPLYIKSVYVISYCKALYMLYEIVIIVYLLRSHRFRWRLWLLKQLTSHIQFHHHLLTI